MLRYPSFSRFKAAPPKEGRSRTSYKNTCAPKRRRTALLHLLIFAAFIAISYAVVLSLFLPSVPVHAAPSGQDLHEKFNRAESGSVTKDTKPSISVKSSPKQTLVESADRQEQHVFEEPEISRSIPSTDLHLKHKDRLTKHNDDSHFDAALTRVLSMLPDEIHVREMLRSIDGTGKEKLRETGLRARAYKEFFEAWENLHLVVDDDEIHVRDDVIQTLRSHNPSKSLASTIRSYEAYRSFLQRLSIMLFPWTAPYFADHMMLHTHFHKGGRGIVLSAGDNQAPYLLTSIQSFRRLGCTLPIEIMYLGDSDLSEDYRAELEMLPDVVTRDLSQMVNDEGWRLAGWAGKPFAILMSSFREVIFIDADALFFRNPEVLFSEPQYTATGALFFKDRLIMPESRKRWLQQILPKDRPLSKQVRQSRFWTGESGHMQESGVVVVDKWRHFVALLLVTRMNGPDRDGNEDEGRIGIYDMVYGDKETFWIGWELVGDQDYAFHDGDVGVMGTITDEPLRRKREEDAKNNGEDQDDTENQPDQDQEPKPHDKKPPPPDPSPANFTICAPQLLHLGVDGKPLWFNGWILNNKFAEKRAKKASAFEAYMSEPRERGDADEDAWQLIDNNVCCLTSEEQPATFTQADRDTLEMITGIARDVGAYGKRGKPGRLG